MNDLAAIVAKAVADALDGVRHPDDILTEPEAAAALRMSVLNLRELRKRGEAPTPRQVGRSYFYRRGDVDAWFNALPVAS
jgi:predicted DNA-binding transcriptional regulator AlpA